MKLTEEQHEYVKPLAEIVLSHISDRGVYTEYNCMCYTAKKHLLFKDAYNFMSILDLYFTTDCYWFTRDGLGLNKRIKFLHALIANKDIEIYEHESGTRDIRIIEPKVKQKFNWQRLITWLTVAIVYIAIAFASCSCASTPYFNETKRTPSGKHTYKRAMWGTTAGCAGMYPSQPIKHSSWHNLHHNNHKTRE